MKKKIFIVDDDELFSSMMEDYLSKHPLFSIYKFPTGEECLENLHEIPDAIVLDFNLDSKNTEAANGLEILKKIKKVLPAVHVVLLSSQSHYGVAANPIKEGAEQYVIKDKDAFKQVDRILKDLLNL